MERKFLMKNTNFRIRFALSFLGALFFISMFSMHAKASFVCEGEDCSDLCFYEDDGSVVNVSSFSEDAVVLIFGRESCAYCQAAIKAVADFTGSETSVKAVFLKIDELNSNDDLWDSLVEKYEPYDIMFTKGNIYQNCQLYYSFKAYDVAPMPNTPRVVVLGKDRKIVDCYDGPQTERLEPDIEAVTPIKRVKPEYSYVTPETITLVVGHSAQLSYGFYPEGSFAYGEWAASYNTDVISIDNNGKVTGLKPGYAFAYYSINGSLKSCIVYVESEGLAEEGGRQAYYKGNEIDTSKNGFIWFDGGRYYLVNGVVDKNKSGMVQDPNNKNDWYYCVFGKVLTQKNGLVQYNGKWFMVKNGWLDTTYTGFAEYDGGLFFVARGQLKTEKKGLAQDPNNPDDWYFCSNGQVQKKKTGIAIYNKAGFYVENGKLNPNFTGKYTERGVTYNVVNGRVI